MREYSVLLIILLSACASLQPKQGVEGQVVWVAGNQMPGPGSKNPTPTGVQRELHVYELTTIDKATRSPEGFYSDIKTKLVATVTTKENGSFKLQLPPGQYTLFIKEDNGLFANRFDKNNAINPVIVTQKQYTWLQIKVDYKAAY